MKHAAGRFRRFRRPFAEGPFRRLWVALLLSDFGDAIGRIALVILVFQETESGFAAALVPALSVVPFLGVGQLLTSYVERWPRRRVLVTSDLIRAAAFGTMALPIGTPARLALLTVASVVEPPFLAIRRAVTPSTLPEAQFSDGVSLLSATTEAALLSGAALGGLLTAQFGAAPVMAINAVTFLASAVVMVGLPVQPLVLAATARQRLRAGWTAMRSDPVVRRVWVWFPALSATALGLEAIITPYVFDTLDRGETLVGLLAGVISVGVVGSAALMPSGKNHRSMYRRMGAVAALGSAIALVGFLIPVSVAGAFLAFTGAGIIFSARIPSQVLYGERLDEAVLASAASLADGAYAVALISGALVAGALVDLFDPRVAAVAIAGCGLVGGVWVTLRPPETAAS